MKHLITYLLAACLLVPSWSMAEQLTLEELVQKLENAKPWKREKIEALFGVKLDDSIMSSDIKEYTANGLFAYKEGLIIDMIDYSESGLTGETFTVAVSLSEKTSCFTLERIRKLYPNEALAFGTKAGDMQFRVITRPWGELGFKFDDRKDHEGCLMFFGIVTNEFRPRLHRCLPPLD